MSKKDVNDALIEAHKADQVRAQVQIDRLEAMNKKLEKPAHRFYVGQPVVGVNSKGEDCFRGMYHRKDGEGRHEIYMHNGTTKTYTDCKPDLTLKSITNWIEWDGGDCPVGDNVMVNIEHNDGTTNYLNAGIARWHNVARYAVILLPEFIE